MTQVNEVYKCKICGNIVEMVHDGAGELICCGVPMERFSEKSQDQGLEKHVPVTERNGKTVKVKVGSIPHPMEPEHYIEWVEIVSGNKVYRQFLNPGSMPEAEFEIEADQILVREYCNLHGLWKTEA